MIKGLILLLLCPVFSFGQVCTDNYGRMVTRCASAKEEVDFYKQVNAYLEKREPKMFFYVDIDPVESIYYSRIGGIGNVQKKGVYTLQRAAWGIHVSGPKERIIELINYGIRNYRKLKRQYRNANKQAAW